MSLFDSYDENRTAVLNPWNVYQPVEGFPETIIITFGSAILNLALENCMRVSRWKFLRREGACGCTDSAPQNPSASAVFPWAHQ